MVYIKSAPPAIPFDTIVTGMGRTEPPNGLAKKEEQKAAVCYFGGICRSHAAPSIPAPGFPNLP